MYWYLSAKVYSHPAKMWQHILKPNFSFLNFCAHHLFTTEGHQRFHIRLLSGKDSLNGLFADHVFYLSSAEIKFFGKKMGVDFRQFRHHRIPDLTLDIHGRIIELHFVEKAALECLIQVLRKVCRGNQDSLKIFHLLENDVLKTVLHFVDCSFCPRFPDAKNGVGLIEQKYRCNR